MRLTLAPKPLLVACLAGTRRLPALHCSTVPDALSEVRRRVREASGERDVRLVAVSKTKPAALLREAYDAGQREFGENYVQELVEKAPTLPDDMQWRFIGKLQSNKAKVLVEGVPNLVAVETVDSAKLADRLQKAAAAALEARGGTPLDIYVQVNTSPWEGTKGGVTPEGAAELAAHVAAACPALRFRGVMTIGAPGDERCFGALRDARDAAAAALSVPADSLELSLGMSGDFEAAIAAGSDSVRVGSSIFGAREYKASKP